MHKTSQRCTALRVQVTGIERYSMQRVTTQACSARFTILPTAAGRGDDDLLLTIAADALATIPAGADPSASKLIPS